MILPAFLLVVLFSCSQAVEDENSEVPFVVASQDGLDIPNVSNLLPESAFPPLTSQQPSSLAIEEDSPASRGRSDIEIEEEQPRGYVYPKPSNPLYLPPFKTLDAKLPLGNIAAFAQDGSLDEIERSPRSPQRQTFYPYPSPPRPRPIPSRPTGWAYPGIRPLPALYGRPTSLLEGIVP